MCIIVDVAQTITDQNRITSGVIWKEMLKFFLPLAVGSLVQQLYNTVDAIIIGRFVGKAALAAVGGSAMTLSFIIISIFTGLSAGVTVIIAQHYGAEDRRNLHTALHTAYAFGIISSILITAIGLLFNPFILRMMRTPDELMGPSVTYLNIYFGGVTATILYNMGSSIMRAVGDSRRPLIYLAVCSVLNILLDLLFVVVFRFGIEGAAVATVMSQAISAALVTRALMHSYDLFSLRLREIRLDRKMLRAQLRIGIPGALQSLTYGFTNVIIQASVNSFGTDTIAAWAAYGKLDVIFWACSSSFGIAVTTFCGQNYGAARFDRVFKSVRTAFAMSFAICGSIMLILYVFAAPLFSMFVTDTDVINIGVMMVHYMMPCYLCGIVIEIFSGALRGLGDVKWPTVFTLGGILGVRLPWLLFLVPAIHTIQMAILSYPAAWVGTLVFLIPYYFMRRKRLLSGALYSYEQ